MSAFGAFLTGYDCRTLRSLTRGEAGTLRCGCHAVELGRGAPSPQAAPFPADRRLRARRPRRAGFLHAAEFADRD